MSEATDVRSPGTTRTDGKHGRGGADSLGDRVRSLRLGERAAKGAGGGKSSVVPWGLAGILMVTCLALGYRTYRLSPGGMSRPTEAAPVVAAATPSSTEAPKAAEGEVVLESKGYIVAVHQIQVSPNKVSGALVNISDLLLEGQRVKKGDELARIDPRDYKAHVDRLSMVLNEYRRRLLELRETYEKEVKQAVANVALGEARLRLSKIKLANTITSGIASSREQNDESSLVAQQDEASLDNAKEALAVLRASRPRQIEQAEARVKQAEADLDEAEWLLGNCSIRAPIDGIILRKNAEYGNFVSTGALSNGSGGISVSLCDMADLADVEVDLSIQERDVAQVVKDQRCLVMPEAFRNYKPFLKLYPKGCSGYVSRLMPIADRAKGAVPVRVKVLVPPEEAGVYLKPDMSAVVSFLKGEK